MKGRDSIEERQRHFRNRAADYKVLVPFLAHGIKRWQIVCLATSSAIAGIAQAAVLVVVVRIAIAISSSHSAQRATLAFGGMALEMSLRQLFLLALGLVVVWLMSQTASAYLPARMSTDMLAKLRYELITRVIESSWQEQSQEQEGHLFDILTEQTIRASQAVLFMSTALVSLFNFLALVGTAILLNAYAAMAVVAVAVFLFYALRPLSLIARRQSKARSDASLRYATAVSQSLRLGEEIQTFGVKRAFTEEMRHTIDEVRRPWCNVQFLSSVVPAIYQAMGGLFIVAGLFLVSVIGPGRVASLSTVIILLFRSMGYSQNLQGLYNGVNEVLPYINVISDKYGSYGATPSFCERSSATKIETLSFRNVSYMYEGKEAGPAIRDVSFQIDAGYAVGVVGPSGSGKSTLLQILLGLRSPTSGSYLVNSIAMEDVDHDDWTRQVAYVPQNSKLIEGTVEENIRFRRDWISADGIRRAAALANIDREISSWPRQFQTEIGEGRYGLSGGQKQRICLARALAGEPTILVLDEATSALDLTSEMLIKDSLNGLKGTVTMFIAAHRLSTLEMCDLFIVLEEGQVQDIGSPERVTISNSWFSEIRQLSQTSMDWDAESWGTQ